MSDNPKLDRAYSLKTPADSVALYGDWATTYDADFVDASGYVLHIHVAVAYAEQGGRGPVLDMGAGTGVCGEALAKLGVGPIHATDISKDMLDIAAQKEVYASHFTGDILAGLDVTEGQYSGVVSSGTFTLGHVGPSGLDEVVRVLSPGGLAVIAVRDTHYESEGFAAKLRELEPALGSIGFETVQIYALETGDHAGDEAILVLMRKR